jgi:hypothetical protein
MTELDLYKFIKEKECEWRWIEDDGVHLILFVSHYDLREFCDMLYAAFDCGVLPCETRLQPDGSVALCPFEEVCEYFDIDAEKVFPKEDEK